jgi:hypothetical protein
MTRVRFHRRGFIHLRSKVWFPTAVQIPVSWIKVRGVRTEIRKRHANLGTC